MQLAIKGFDSAWNRRHKVSAFAQSEFAPADTGKNAWLHKGVNTPIYRSWLNSGFYASVKLQNILAAKGAFAFEHGLQLLNI